MISLSMKEQKVEEQHLIYLLKAENSILSEENRRLKQILNEHGIAYRKMEVHEPPFQREALNTIVHKRMELFKAYFKGRDDVYASRWFGKKDDKKKYSPVVKKKYKQWDEATHSFIIKPPASDAGESLYEPFTDEVIYRHLAAREKNDLAAGLYMVVNDDACYLAVIDFDKGTWQQDLQHVANVAAARGIPYLAERSQSGDGGHLWFFFEGIIMAKKARLLCNSLITLTMVTYPQLRMKTYDRVFPSQDRVTKDGLGSLIALPLQGHARLSGNTLFLDDSLQPYENPWEALERTRKICEEEIDHFFATLGDNFDIGPLGIGKSGKWASWSVPHTLDLPLPMTLAATTGKTVPTVTSDIEIIKPLSIEITLFNGIRIPLFNLFPSLINALKRIASFQNPEFYRAQNMRLSTWDKPRIICRAELAEDDDGIMILPRGCLEAVRELFFKHEIALTISDRRVRGHRCSFTFFGSLRNEQKAAVDALSNYECGILSAPTGFGKTVIGAALIARKQMATLVIVHTKPLLEQWRTRLGSFLLDGGKSVEPGILGGGENSLGGRVDIAIINSLAQKEHIRHVTDYGMVIVDECHHVAAVSYERVIQAVCATYVYGLTATPIRYDGHHEIMFMQCGPIRYQVDQARWAEDRGLLGRVIPRFSSFRCDHKNMDIQHIYEKLTLDASRNALIVQDIKKHLEQGRSILVLSTRLEQLKLLEAELARFSIRALVMTGSQSAKVKRQVASYLLEIKESEAPALILSTGKYIGEGFDFPLLDTLVLAAPIAWKGNVIQYTGRVSRSHSGKTDILVLDYVDFKIPVLMRMFGKRVNAYHRIGFAISTDEQEPREKLLYSATEYREKFENDLSSSTGLVIFSIPYLACVSVKRLLPFLENIVKDREVRMIVRPSHHFPHARAIDALYRQLQELGIQLQVVDGELANYMLIGDRIIWYGSINIFGKVNPEDTLLRLDDPTYWVDLARLPSQ